MLLGGVLNQATDDTLAFTPDRKTVFFDRSAGGPSKTTMVSRQIGGRWTKPEVASFSGHWFDQDPVVSPDGSHLLFGSNRPTHFDGSPLSQRYFTTFASPGSNLWRSDRVRGDWGLPGWLSPRVNQGPFVDFPSIAGNGTLYFTRYDAASKRVQLFKMDASGHGYRLPRRVIIGDPMVAIHEPAVAPGQSYIVSDYGRVKGGLERLSIVFRERGGWTEPVDLGDESNGSMP